MIENLKRDMVLRALPAGAHSALAFRRGAEAVFVSGVVDSWGRQRCRLQLLGSREPKLPPAGADVDVVATRPDGVYRLPGNVVEIGSRGLSRLAGPQWDVTVRVHFERATRLQQRGFFRLSGDWRAVVCRGTTRDIGAEEDFRAVRIGNLSAGGMLLEDRHRGLCEGADFFGLLDLGDEGDPVRFEAQVVRRDVRSTANATLWGCRFSDLPEEEETRIVRMMHRHVLARLSRRTGEGDEKTLPVLAKSA
jgi:hypothetical protein